MNHLNDTMTSQDEIENEYTCSICKEIYNKPTRISCGHVFCEDCIRDSEAKSDTKCALCRENYETSRMFYDVDMQHQLKNLRGACQNCGLLITLQQLRIHSAGCHSRPVQHKFQPVAQTSQPIPKPDNRSTFRCPYCPQQNLDCQSLIKHCNDQHKQSNKQVVCPVCSSMPWGDPNQKSSNFLQHLNVRHKFEYQTYVDFEEDDDAMLQMALKASLEQK